MSMSDYDNVVALMEQLQLISTKKRNRPEDEGPQDIDLNEIRSRAIKEVRAQKIYEQYRNKRETRQRPRTTETMTTSHNMVYCTKQFLDFTKTEICNNLVIASIYYVSATLFIEGEGPELTDEQFEAQQTKQTDSLRILSSLYCQLLMSPLSARMRVREERVFYETLICYLDACACFATHTENPEHVYEILAKVFRKGMQDPKARHGAEFLPITEIVRRNWLSQRVPGKTRAKMSREALKGTTDLISPMCDSDEQAATVAEDGEDIWNPDGLPKTFSIPLDVSVIPRADIIDLTPPKTVDPSKLS